MNCIRHRGKIIESPRQLRGSKVLTVAAPNARAGEDKFFVVVQHKDGSITDHFPYDVVDLDEEDARKAANAETRRQDGAR